MEPSRVRNHILIISHEVIGRQMAGPGIRYYQLANVLSREFKVTLAVPQENPFDSQNSGVVFSSFRRGDWASVEERVGDSQVVICPSDIANEFPKLGTDGTALVVDGYDPLWAEWLALNTATPEYVEKYWQTRLEQLHRQYLAADFIICANERQRDWLLGLLEANGRINPYTFRDDPSLRKLIDVVPYGLPEIPPQATRQMVKGVWKGIEKNDRVILWGGGLWPWLDPLTAIRAFAQVYEQRRGARLIFPGTVHPNPAMRTMPTHNDAARELATQLGLLDRGVFFGDWVPYDDWQNVLLESDVALTLHGEETFESRLAFRSRVFDYIWAGLPIVASRGDATSDLIAENGWGVIVESQDVDETARAILHLLDAPEEYRQRIEQSRPQWTWERAAEPLMRFCRAPRRAPDKAALWDQLGNSHDMAHLQQAREENARLKNVVEAYERRRSVRWANRISRFVKRSP